MESPMVLSLENLRARYNYVEITEKNIRHGRIAYKQDLFGFGDILCLGDDEVCVVQTTSRANMNARIKKITESDVVGHVRKAGIRILVQGWRKSAKTGEMVLSEVDLS